MLTPISPRSEVVSEAELVIGEKYLVTDGIETDSGIYYGLMEYEGKIYRQFLNQEHRIVLAGRKAFMAHIED